MKTSELQGSILLLLVVQGCVIGRSDGGNSAALSRCTDTEAVVDLTSDEGELCIWFLPPSPWFIFVPAFEKVTHYRVYFHLDNAKKTAVLYRIERGWSRNTSGLPTPTSNQPSPRKRVLNSPYAASAPPDTGVGHNRDETYAFDAQKIDGKWVVMKDNYPGPDDCSLLSEDGKVISSVSLGAVRIERTAGETPTPYVTWDTEGRYIVFGHDSALPGSRIPGSAIVIWHYGRVLPNLDRYETNLNRYFIWHWNQFEPRTEYKSLLH